MTNDEALKMALEALEEIHVGNMTPMAEANWNKAIAAIKEALAQPEQEPVAVDCCANCLRPKHEHMGGYCPNPYTTVWHAWDYPFTPDATPPQRKPLTEKEIVDLLPDAQHGWTTAIYGKWVARAVERAHGIKGE